MTDSEKEEQAQRNRERLPRFAAWLATVRAWDPKARVLWAREGEVERGRRPAPVRSMDADQWLRYVRTGELPC